MYVCVSLFERVVHPMPLIISLDIEFEGAGKKNRPHPNQIRANFQWAKSDSISWTLLNCEETYVLLNIYRDKERSRWMRNRFCFNEFRIAQYTVCSVPLCTLWKLVQFHTIAIWPERVKITAEWPMSSFVSYNHTNSSARQKNHSICLLLQHYNFVVVVCSCSRWAQTLCF